MRPSPLPLGPRSAAEDGAALSESRRTILESLRSQTEPTTLAALALMAGLHENTVREHLLALEGLHLVERRTAEPDGRGRPAWLWSALGPSSRSGPGSEYAGLAATLARTLARTSPDPVGAAHTAGAEWGRDLAHARPAETTGAAAARRQVVALLEEMGFAPEADQRARRIRLTRCPLLEAARQHPEIVCSVHSGLVDGALTEYGAGRTSGELTPFAEPGACLLRLTTDRAAPDDR